MLAEGMTTSEVARRLNHSERTIKSVPHDVITRLGLRNRTQAVAYAIRRRCGLTRWAAHRRTPPPAAVGAGCRPRHLLPGTARGPPASGSGMTVPLSMGCPGGAVGDVDERSGHRPVRCNAGRLSEGRSA
ncbi:helix-turn-helix transcriptional regulator [Streptomyces sp. NPDC014676]|uniref:helix-turn-helix domain-containing protein n=1 Tax=Streptomyces sp. NPDC014676 TaxID=3364879 RepID=UPI003702FF56